MQSTELPAIVEIANSVGPGKYLMPNETYRKLVRAVIIVGSFCEDPERREQYWDQVCISFPCQTHSKKTPVLTSNQTCFFVL